MLSERHVVSLGRVLVLAAIAIGCTSRASDAELVSRELRILEKYFILHVLYLDEERDIPQSLAKAIEQWQEAMPLDDHGVSPEYCPYLVSGHDPWGHEFVYAVSAEGNELVIRSLGPNGADDEGQNDDIECSIRLDK